MAEILETLIVKLLADDGDLEKQLKDIVTQAKTYGQQASKAFNTASNLNFGGTSGSANASNASFKQASNAADEFRTKLRNLDAEVRRGAIGANAGAKAFDALTKEMVQQRGTLPAVSKGYEQLSVQISRSASSADRLRGRVNGLSFANQIRGANGFASSMRVLQGEIALFVSALGINRLVRGLNDASESYYSAVIAQRLYDRELEKSGTSIESGARAVKALASELRTTDDVIQNGAVQLLRYGATIEQAEVLMRSGAASGLAFGRTVSQGIEAIAQAIVGEQSQILNRIGIAGNLSTAYTQYAKDLGVAKDELTQQQKVQAALNMILRETASEIEALPVLFDGLAGAKNRFSVATTLASRAVGQEFEPALTALYDAGAEVLTLFTDNLVPVLAQQFNPLIEDSVDNLTNFITRLTDSSEAGVELRAQMSATSTVLITFGEGFLIAGTYAFGFVTDVLGGFAGIGAAIGTVSVQFENFVGGLAVGGLAISQLLSPNLQTRSLGIASLAGLKQQGVFDAGAFDFNDILNSAAQAQDAYRKSAQGAYDTAAASIERLTNLGPNVEAFFDAMAKGGGEGVKNALSSLTDINNVVEDMDGSTSSTTKKIRTFNDALADYRQGLNEINLTYDVTGDKQKALEEQLRLTEGSFKELVSLALSDGFLSDSERSTIQLFADDLTVLTDKVEDFTTKANKTITLTIKPVVEVTDSVAVGEGVYDPSTGTRSQNPNFSVSVIPAESIPNPEAYTSVATAIDVVTTAQVDLVEAFSVSVQPIADVTDAIDVATTALFRLSESGGLIPRTFASVKTAIDVTPDVLVTLSDEVDIATNALFRFTESGGKVPRVFADVKDAIDVSITPIVEYANAMGQLVDSLPSNTPSLDFIFGGGTPTQTLNFLPPELKELNNAVQIIDSLTAAMKRLGGTDSDLSRFADSVIETTNVVTDLATSIASGDVFAIAASSIQAAGFVLSEIVDVFRNRVKEGIKEIAGSFDLLSESTIEALTKTKIITDFFLFIPYSKQDIDKEASELGYSIANSVATGIAQGLTDADFNFAEFFDNLIIQLKAEAIVNLPATQKFILDYTLLLQKIFEDGIVTAAEQAQLDAFETTFGDYLDKQREAIGLPPSSTSGSTSTSDSIQTNPLQFGNSPSAISFAVNSDFLEGSRNMNKAALLLIDVFGGAGVPDMNVTTTGPDYAAFTTTQRNLNETYSKVITMYNRVLDEGFKFDFGSGTTQNVNSLTARKR